MGKTPGQPSKLLCVGSIAYDSIITPFGEIHKTLGGSASHFALASGFFAPTAIVGVVGNDFKHFSVFIKHKVDISGLKQKPGKTFHWQGKYHKDLNHRDTLKTELGVFADFVPELTFRHAQSTYVFLGNIHPKLQLEVLKQIQSAQRTKFIGLDTMNFWINSAKADLLKVIKQVHLLTLNETEAQELSHTTNLFDSAQKIYKLMNPKLKPLLIIKQGAQGMTLFFANGKNAKLNHFSLPAVKLKKVKDPTGAGDVFAGALMGYIAKHQNTTLNFIKTACEIATVLASFCVEDFGTLKLTNLDFEAIETRLKKYQKTLSSTMSKT